MCAFMSCKDTEDCHRSLTRFILERRSFDMTYFISIDAAKYEHIASCYSHSTGELIVNSLHFNHNDKGFNSL